MFPDSVVQVQTSLWDVSQQWADELLDIEARARELVVRRYTCVPDDGLYSLPLLVTDSVDRIHSGQRQLR